MALKGLLRAPWFTGGVILILALGLGVNLALGTLLQRLLLRPFDGPSPERVVQVLHRAEGAAQPRSCSGYDYLALRDSLKGLSHLAAATRYAGVLELGDRVERIGVSRVSASTFPMLGLPSYFGPETDQGTQARCLVVTHAFWTSHLGGDPRAMGERLRLDGEDWTIAGILPRAFRIPSDLGGGAILVPLALTPKEVQARDRTFLNLLGRLAPGVSRAEAEQEVAACYLALERQIRGKHHVAQIRLPLQIDAQIPQRSHKITVILLSGLSVLLIACANVANLSLTRWLPRRREMGLRSAMGASRWIALRPLLFECLFLALAGGILAVLLQTQTQKVMTSLLRASLPALVVAEPESHLGLTVVLSLTATLFLAVPVTWGMARFDLLQSVKDSARGTGSRGHGRLRCLLVVTQVATATALVGVSLLLARSLRNQLALDLGFQPQGVLTTRVQLPKKTYHTDADRLAVQRTLLDRAMALPGVSHAAMVEDLPLSGNSFSATFQTSEPREKPRSALIHVVGGTYFEALGHPLLAGRPPEREEADACVVSSRLAKAGWGDPNPLGQSLTILDRTFRVVGVAAETRHIDLYAPPQEAVYLPLLAQPSDSFHLVLRTAAEPMSLAASVSTMIRGVDRGLPVDTPRPLTHHLQRLTREERAVGLICSTIAILTLLLAGLGLGSSLSLVVVQRTPELGVRMALGARGSSILTQILGQGMRQVLVGLALGLPATIGLGSLLQGMLFDLKPSDPQTLILVAGVLAMSGLVASLLPALRAARIQPLETLRQA